MTFWTSLLLLLCLPLCGCAYLTTYTRPIDLRDGSVAIDVKQRVVFSQVRPDKKTPQTVVCAEPSPDALTVIGASGGLSFSDPTGRSANLTAALTESGSSIGLRTQSIQLLRDAMYRLCEGYASGAVDQTDFAAMQRRYQSTMMGLIAIEQLTGPIVATQALLRSSAAASAGVGASDPAVTAAQAKVDAATEAELKAQAELDTAHTKIGQKREEARKEEVKIQEERKKAEAEKRSPDQALIDSATERLQTLRAEVRASTDEVTDKRRRLDQAEKSLATARADLVASKSRSSTSADSGGSLGAIARATQGSNEALATAVKEIVQEINRSYSKDGCLALVTELVRDPEAIRRLASVDAAAGKSEEKSTGESGEKLAEASRALGKARANQSYIRGLADNASSPKEKNAALADAQLADQELETADRAYKAALEDATRAREVNDRASAVAVLKTSLQLCQRILGEDSSKPTK